MAQSTNDVIPTSMRIAVLMDLETFYPALTGWPRPTPRKGRSSTTSSSRAARTCRTPCRSAWGRSSPPIGRVLARCASKIRRAAESLLELNIGATAAGTGLNSDPRYQQRWWRTWPS